MTVVFVHGAGISGPAAWPQQAAQAAQAEGPWVFLSRDVDGDDVAKDALRILDELRPVGGGHVVAHSYGANAALLAARAEATLVRSLTLFEPACFDLARGMPAVEEHIALMDPVFEVADDPSVSAAEFSRRFSAAMGTQPPDVPADELDARVRRLRALRPPWGRGLRTDTVASVRTLVVTGGSTPLYEETAHALVGAGARHHVIAGAGHRPQDAAEATPVLRTFWE